MKLILCDVNTDLCIAWSKHFAGCKDVEIYNHYFQEVPEWDCIVSPANSFGLMDGGIDKAIIDFFGLDLMYRVQQHILKNYYGEQPIGTAFAIETGNDLHKYLVHTPTMRVPKSVANTDIVYNAMRAMMIEVLKYPDIKTVLCSGLGTLTGAVSPDEAARQMSLAYKSIINPPTEINWGVALTIDDRVGV